MKLNFKSNRGITLIALVITIIVLLILAGILISMLSGDNGILQKATDAKTNTDSAQIKERVQLAYLAAMAGNQGKATEPYLTEALDQEFGDGNYNLWEDLLGVTIDGKYYGFDGSITHEGGWKQKDDGTIENADGTITGIKIGDYVNYSPANSEITSITSYEIDNGYGDQTLNLTDYNGGWQILGINNGEIELISQNVVTNTDFYLKGRTGYQNAETELNKVASLYGYGTHAIRARSVNVNDINKITGYNPNAEGIKNPTAEEIASGNKYGKDQLDEYDNEVTYSWIGTNYPKYTSTNENTGNIVESHNANKSSYGDFKKAFSWYDFSNNSWKKSSYTSSASTESPVEITKLTSTGYSYYPETLTTNYNTSATTGITYNSAERQMLFDKTYWLASRCVSTDARWRRSLSCTCCDFV